MIIDVMTQVLKGLEGDGVLLEEIHAGRVVGRLGVPHLAVVLGQHALAKADDVRNLRRRTGFGLRHRAGVGRGHGEGLPAGVDVDGG